MAIEKSLTQEQEALMKGQVGFGAAPDPTEGMPALVEDDTEGGITVEFGDEDPNEEIQQALMESDHYANLSEFIDEDILDKLGDDILSKVRADDEGRDEWLGILKDGIKLLGLKIEQLSEPFEGACAATHPLLIESIVKFQAKAYTELLPSAGPVKTKIMGKESPDKVAQSHRVRTFMNYEIMDMMPEYAPELDRLLFYLGLAGSAFKKTYFDPVLQRPMTQFVKAEDFIVPYSATSLASCERYAHKIEMSYNDILKNQANDYFRQTELGVGVQESPNEAQEEHDRIEGRSYGTVDDNIHTLYEVHINIDLPGFEHTKEGERTGIALPYIVTIDEESGKILALRRNWREGDRQFKKRLYFTHYQFVPGLGFYGYGYLHLIGGLALASTATMRQLIDAGTFATLPAGFKAHGLRVVGDSGPFQPGEFKDVNAPAMDLTKAIIPLPFKEPSNTLMNLLTFVVQAAEKFADSTEQLVSEARSYGPVGTVMALLEQGGKLFSAIHKRLHYAQGQDFKILAELNYEWLPPSYPYEVSGGAQNVFRADFDGRIDVIPVSDPNMPTQAHRIAKAQAEFAIAAQAPQEHNMREVLMSVYEALGEDQEHIQRILKQPPQQAQPQDLITENQNAIMGQALKAGMDQNHSAHIKGHFAFAQLPLVQQNQLAASALLGHIQEHLALDYRLKIQQIIGQQLPPPGTPIPPQVENQIATAAAQATQQMLQDDTMQQIMNDPEMMIAWKGLQIEAQKVANKYEIDLEELGLKKTEMLVDDINVDADRRKDVLIAKYKSMPTPEGRKYASDKGGQ